MTDPLPADALAGTLARLIARLSDPLPMPGGPGSGRPMFPPDSGFPPEDFPDLMRRPRLAVEGMEFTQSTQHYRSRHGETNSVPLVALKPMVVRVYPHVTRALLHQDTISGQRVTGELVVSQSNRELFRTGPTRPEGVRLGSAAELDRTLWDRELSFPAGGGGGIGTAVGDVNREFRLLHRNPPLNFLVPAYYLRPGLTDIRVRLRTESGAEAETWERILLHDVGAPRISLVRISWKDSKGTVHRPTDAEMLGILNLSQRMLPFPYFDTMIVGIEETRTDDFPATATNGGCNPAWAGLLARLREMQKLIQFFGGPDITFGVVSAAGVAPGQTVNSGCGNGAQGVGGALVEFEGSAAHELGHIYGRAHVSVPGDMNNDPNYPSYGGIATSIGEVGVDTGARTPELKDPRVTSDVMSYAGPQWISPHTYRGIFDARARWASAPAQPGRVRQVLLVSFRLAREMSGTRRVEITSLHRLSAPHLPPPVPGPASRSVSIDLLDDRDQIIATHHAQAVRATACCGCGSHHGLDDREPWLEFTEAIAWPEETEVAALSFHRGEEPITQIRVGQPPRLELMGPEVGDGALEFTVRAAHPEETPSVIVLFSGDDGETWTPIAIDPPQEEPVRIGFDRLSGGERCRLRAIATAELLSVERTSDPFEIPQARRDLHLHLDTDPCRPGEVRLAARINTRGRGGVRPAEIVWTSDRDGDLGRGYELSVALSPGEHAIVATIPDGLGGSVSARGIIIVSG